MSESEWKERYATIIRLLDSVSTWAEFEHCRDTIVILYGEPGAPEPLGVMHAKVDAQ